MAGAQKGVLISIFFMTALLKGTSQYIDDGVGEPPIYCFQCNSAIDFDCNNIQANETSSYHYKPCLDTEKYNGFKPFCRKIIQRIFPRENMEVVIRKCGWMRHPRLDCYSVRNEDHTETSCQCFEPGCNRGPALLPAALLPALSLTLTLWVCSLHYSYS